MRSRRDCDCPPIPQKLFSSSGCSMNMIYKNVCGLGGVWEQRCGRGRRPVLANFRCRLRFLAACQEKKNRKPRSPCVRPRRGARPHSPVARRPPGGRARRRRRSHADWRELARLERTEVDVAKVFSGDARLARKSSPHSACHFRLAALQIISAQRRCAKSAAGTLTTSRKMPTSGCASPASDIDQA